VRRSASACLGILEMEPCRESAFVSWILCFLNFSSQAINLRRRLNYIAEDSERQGKMRKF
jgi:hypothetical protein